MRLLRFSFKLRRGGGQAQGAPSRRVEARRVVSSEEGCTCFVLVACDAVPCTVAAHYAQRVRALRLADTAPFGPRLLKR
jgi:hypothetical protein